MNKDDILRKIKACLSRANSDNPHEAEISLNQAKRLMEMYGIDHEDVEMSDIKTAYTKGSGNNKLPLYEMVLINALSKAFNCENYHEYSRFGRGQIIFVGLHPNEELATYYFEVLYRKLKKARNQYIQEKLSRCHKQTKTRRADLFCGAWVNIIVKLINKTFVSQQSEQANNLLRLYCQKNFADYTETSQTKARHVGFTEKDVEAIQAGADAALKVQINHGVGKNGASPMLPASPPRLTY